MHVATKSLKRGLHEGPIMPPQGLIMPLGRSNKYNQKEKWKNEKWNGNK
jgi:hypothetical protein